MKRDMALIKRILEFVDADESPPRLNDGWTNGTEIELEDVPIYDLSHNILLLRDSGFVEVVEAEWGEMPRIARMTWKGYDLLEQLRREEREYERFAARCRMREEKK